MALFELMVGWEDKFPAARFRFVFFGKLISPVGADERTRAYIRKPVFAVCDSGKGRTHRNNVQAIG